MDWLDKQAKLAVVQDEPENTIVVQMQETEMTPSSCASEDVRVLIARPFGSLADDRIGVKASHLAGF